MELINLKTMEIVDVEKPTEYENFKKTILTIGIFDGVHFGHEEIINKLNETRDNLGIEYKSALMTFDPHPDYVLNKRQNNGYLTPIKERINIFKSKGIDYLIIFHFTKLIAELDYHEFYNRYLSNFALFVIGYDFTFGAKALGTAKFLKEMKKDTIIVSEVTSNDIKVSSTAIREALKKGDLEVIDNMMDSHYTIKGVVTTGAHIGSSIGFPTANIKLDGEYCDIKNGVYYVYVKYNNKKYSGIANVGHNPSINFVKDKRLEVHLFDFNLNIYGETIEVSFVKYMRDEKKFNNKEELINQINKDIEQAKDYETFYN